jgi:hypothetical protein
MVSWTWFWIWEQYDLFYKSAIFSIPHIVFIDHLGSILQKQKDCCSLEHLSVFGLPHLHRKLLTS